MCSTFARLLLVATSLAPVAIVYGFAGLPGRPLLALALLGTAIALAVVSRGLLSLTRCRIAPEWLAVEGGEVRDSELLAFLVAYALPVVAIAGPCSGSVWGSGPSSFSRVCSMRQTR
jgi:hypothetical protein